MPAWTLDAALEAVRRVQPGAMAAGFYIAVAGGVVNCGYSHKDLDLVAVNRDATSRAADLVEVLTAEWGNGFTRHDVYGRVHLTWATPPVEITIVEPLDL